MIEQAVAASGSGSALMARLHNERYERGIEIRLLPAERAADLMSSEPGDVHPQVWLSVLAEPLPARPQRARRRVRAREDEQAMIDGAAGHAARCLAEWSAGTLDDRAASAAACSSGDAAGAWLGEDGGDRGVVDLRDRTHASVPRGHRVHARDPGPGRRRPAGVARGTSLAVRRARSAYAAAACDPRASRFLR